MLADVPIVSENIRYRKQIGNETETKQKQNPNYYLCIPGKKTAKCDKKRQNVTISGNTVLMLKKLFLGSPLKGNAAASLKISSQYEKNTPYTRPVAYGCLPN